MYKSTGILNYHITKTKGYRLTVEIDQQILEYYFSMIPKYIKVNKPRYRAHITVVRPEKEVPPNLQYWGKYQGEKIEFFYEPGIKNGPMYYWINIWCKRLEDIRRELGLPVISQYTLPPPGFTKCFHSTVANIKNV